MRIAVHEARNLGRLALAAGLGGFALTAAQASQPPVVQAGPSESIVITGTKATPDEARRRAVEFVRGAGVATSQRPVARWEDPVCPRVVGLQAPYAGMVESRLRTIAEEARIDVAREPCRANIVVNFAADAGAVVRAVAVRAPRRLEEVPGGARDALLDGTAPVRWWYSTDTRSRDGMAARDTPLPAVGNAANGAPIIPTGIPTLQHYNSSIVSTQAARVLIAATVVVDVGRVEGMPLDAVASYAALVAFAEIRASDFSPSGSILGLFEADSRLRGLTEWDMAFLGALYRLPLDRSGRRHRGILVRELVAAETGR